MNKLLTLALLAVIIGTVACQEETKGVLVADYKIRYTVAANALDLQAKYKLLSSETGEAAFFPIDGVDVFDKPMNYKSMQGHTDDYYGLKERMEFPNPIKFRFKNQKKELIEQTIEFEPLKRISIDKAVIQRDSGFHLIWESGTLSKKEELRLIFDYETEQPVRMNLVGGSVDQKLYIRKEQITKLKEGRVKVVLMQRRYESYPDESAVLGSYVVEYYHTPIFIDVK